MIIVDFNQVLISNFMVNTREGAEPDKDMVRHMVINSLHYYMTKFKSKYGQMVLATDASNPWRRDVFPNYKHNRRKSRKESDIDWSTVFDFITEIKEEIKQNFPYPVLYVERCEADDIIATMVKYYHQSEPIMIVSGDKDFIQLQRFTNVRQYAPIQKKMIGEEEVPEQYLLEHIIRGDRSDGVPNILSGDDVFVTGEKQKPITKKRLAEFMSGQNIEGDVKRNFKRNATLVDLAKVPEHLQDEIINSYRSYEINDRSKLLTYFVENKLKTLMENISDF